MKKTIVTLSVVLAAVMLAALMLSVASAAPVAPAQKVTFTKTASDETPTVGDVFTFTLFFAPTEELTQVVAIKITDINPAPDYLDILTDTIGGGAKYSSTLGGIVWDGWLIPSSSGLYIPFQVRVTGIPSTALASGCVVTNTATMVDQGAGSLPNATAEAPIRIMPQRIFLPLICRNYSG